MWIFEFTIMDLYETKIELLKFILENENSDFIQGLANFVNKEKADFWDELTYYQQQEIRTGIDELNSGKRVSYQSFLDKLS